MGRGFFVFIMNHITIFMLNTADSTASYLSSEECIEQQIKRENVKTENIFCKQSLPEKRSCFTVKRRNLEYLKGKVAGVGVPLFRDSPTLC